MENKFQTSFIPKSSLDGGGKVRVKTPLNVLFLVSGLMITLTLLAAGDFAYKVYLGKQIEYKQQELTAKERSLDYPAIEEIVRVDRKLGAASDLLNAHIAPSAIFSLLQETTLRRLQFTSFEFSYLSSQKVAISMEGRAANFGVVARQAELFASSTATTGFTSALFSDLNLDEGGSVTFSFLTSVDPRLISYKDNLPSSSVPSAPQAPASTPASTSTNNILP